MHNVYFLILCGGSGTRLWPLSRKDRPKQLLPFIDNKTLLEQTIDRITPLAKNKTQIGIVTIREQVDLIPDKIKAKIGFIIEEPVPRNTGPAILYSCLEVEKKDPNATVVILPADHFIPDESTYRKYLIKAIDYAAANKKIVTLGLMPTKPATGYGYIQANTKTNVIAGTTYSVEKFHEKPDKKQAQIYLEQKNMFWNLGMFVGKVSAFIKEYSKHAPEIVSCMRIYQQTGKSYEKAQNISIDYAIMEKSENISVMPCDFEWSDVGNLDTFLSLQQKHDAKQKQETISIDSKNNIAQTSKRIVAFVGVQDLCVIEDGDILLVARRTEIDKVKEIIKHASQ
ncbi:NTP transferase domain-containing protein [Candidatus Babeliales bacterium]|nr:NTP transferase domain-containing protein [Candidatus Babeliales bacterium]